MFLSRRSPAGRWAAPASGDERLLILQRRDQRLVRGSAPRVTSTVPRGESAPGPAQRVGTSCLCSRGFNRRGQRLQPCRCHSCSCSCSKSSGSALQFRPHPPQWRVREVISRSIPGPRSSGFHGSPPALIDFHACHFALGMTPLARIARQGRGARGRRVGAAEEAGRIGRQELPPPLFEGAGRLRVPA